jgi:hypothetical protein
VLRSPLLIDRTTKERLVNRSIRTRNTAEKPLAIVIAM